MLFEDFDALSEQRVWLDRQTTRWVKELSEGDPDRVLGYHTSKGVPVRKRFSSMVLHFFNREFKLEVQL